MIPSDSDQETDDLAFFVRFPQPSWRRGCLVAIADWETQGIVADHLRRLGYDVWTADTGLSAYRICLDHHANIDVLVCDENLPDLPPLVLFNRLKTQLPALQCCVLASLTHRDSDFKCDRMETLVLDVVGWRSGMLFVNATVTEEPQEH